MEKENKFRTAWFRAPLAKYEEEKGFIFKTQVSQISQRHVEYDDYARVLQNVYEEFDADGYDVVNVIPIVTGELEAVRSKSGNPVDFVGFSITRGAVIVGKKREC